MPDLQGNGLAKSDVRQPEIEIEVQVVGYGAVREVQVVRRAVEIRGDAAQLVAGILQEWTEAQNRRIEFLRGRGSPESRAQIRAIIARTQMVHRVLQAWEGVLAVSREDPIAGDPEN